MKIERKKDDGNRLFLLYFWPFYIVKKDKEWYTYFLNERIQRKGESHEQNPNENPAG